jgi:hypothetical protein
MNVMNMEFFLCAIPASLYIRELTLEKGLMTVMNVGDS